MHARNAKLPQLNSMILDQEGKTRKPIILTKSYGCLLAWVIQDKGGQLFTGLLARLLKMEILHDTVAKLLQCLSNSEQTY